MHSASPVRLNTHHVIKLVALVIMTIDHLGAYVFVEEQWFRAIGRITFPVWFFLVGHALHYRIHWQTMFWAGLLLVVNPWLGQPFFPMNALVTIILCQALLAQVERRRWLADYPATLLVGAVVFWLPTFVLSEYGSLGFLYALMGYAVRSGQMEWRSGKAVAVAAWAGFLLSCFVQSYGFWQSAWIVTGTTLVTLYLARFVHRPVSVPRAWSWAERPLVWLSRMSLQYYVIHRLILQALGVMIGALPTEFRWIDLDKHEAS